MTDIAPSALPWYRQWWAVTLLAIGVMALLFGSVLGGLTWYYYREIQAGRSPSVVLESSYGFTSSVSSTVSFSKIGRDLLETKDDPDKGTKDAPVTVVEFVDFKCPNCLTVAPILSDILAKYPQKVHLIVRDFPAESLHPGATQLAYVGYCAFQQGKFWQFHELAFQNQSSWPATLSNQDIISIAASIGADSGRMVTCAASPEAQREVKEDYLTGVSAGVRGTPTFFINGEKVEGVIPHDIWQRYLESI